MANSKKKFFSLILLILIGFHCVAQAPPPPGPPPPVGLPIDGGLLFGVFFALAYGASKLLKNKQ